MSKGHMEKGIALSQFKNSDESQVLQLRHTEVGESGSQFKLLVESVSDYAILLLDPKGYILSWNAGAERFKGYTAEEAVGKHFSIFYTAEDIDRHCPEQ